MTEHVIETGTPDALWYGTCALGHPLTLDEVLAAFPDREPGWNKAENDYNDALRDAERLIRAAFTAKGGASE